MVGAGRPGGPAGSSPGGPAGSVPYRFTDEPTDCLCNICPECPCFAQHVTDICACCRAGHHDESCGPVPGYETKHDEN